VQRRHTAPPLRGHRGGALTAQRICVGLRWADRVLPDSLVRVDLLRGIETLKAMRVAPAWFSAPEFRGTGYVRCRPSMNRRASLGEGRQPALKRSSMSPTWSTARDPLRS
jgi:hypothetical protein